jgi:hypothetical protein
VRLRSVLVLSLLLLAAAAVADAQPRVEPPTYSVGDRWLRSDGAWDLVRIDRDRYVFSNGPGAEIHLTRTLAVARWARGGRFFELDPPVELQWPLKVGRVATAETRWITHGCPAGCPRRITLSVDKYEDVKVPAGTFKAFRISLESGPPDRFRDQWSRTHPGAWHAALTLWFAPEIGRYVKVVADRDFGGWSAGGWTSVLLDVERPAPLAVALTDLAGDTRVDREVLPLAGKVTSGKGVKQVTVTLNGAEVLRAGDAQNPGREVTLRTSLTLRGGRNVLLVTATDAEGETRQEARAIVYERSAAPGPRMREPQPLVSEPDGSQAPAVVTARTTSSSAALVSEPPAPGAATEPPAPPAPRPMLPGPVVTRPDARPMPPAVQPPLLATPTPRPAAPAGTAAVVATPVPRPETPVAEPVARATATPPAAPPLEVRISSPGDRVRVDQESIALAGLVAGGRGVSHVAVSLNGVEMVRRDEKTPLRALPLNLPIRLREGQNTLVVTATDADGLVQQEVRSVEYARPVPLTIAVRYPEDRASVAEESIVAAAVVTSGKGVARVQVSLNGVSVADQTERTPQTSVVVTTPLTLRAGTNAIVVAATDAAGVTRQELRTVTFDPPRVAIAPPPPAPAAPARNQWAVVIGVGAYESVAIPRLRYTVPDAEAIYETLIGPAGFKKENVLLLTDRSERKPTLRNIKWALGTFLGRSAQKDDTVLIFFAGHGAPEVDTRGLERDGLAKYLIPSDADPDDLYSTALPMDELQTIFGRIEAERVVAFLDACYSGAAGGRTFAAKKTRAGSVDDLFLERLTRSKGRAIVTASRPSEVSIELPELGHGIFSYYLVNALKGAGDLNRDGIVSLQEVYEYLEQQVTAKSRAVGGNQHPVMKGELEGVLPLAKVRGK